MKSAVKFTENFTLTTIDRELQSDTGTRRLLPVVYVVEKGKPYIYTALGPSVAYVIEGSHLCSMGICFKHLSALRGV